jgi:DNA-directed RNA polymerase subunit RPC12/RpoP
MFKKYFEKRRKFKCPYCSADIELGLWEWLKCPHFFDIWRYVKCPVCEIRLWMKRV